MKFKFEFKLDIETQHQYPIYLKIWKLNLNKSTLPENIQSLNQINFTKNKFKYQSKLERKKFQTISIKFNPQNKFEKNKSSSMNPLRYQPDM